MLDFVVKACFNDHDLNNRTKEVLKISDEFKLCTNHSSHICVDCKERYLSLINDYNSIKINENVCIDVVDLVSDYYLFRILSYLLNVS